MIITCFKCSQFHPLQKLNENVIKEEKILTKTGNSRRRLQKKYLGCWFALVARREGSSQVTLLGSSTNGRCAQYHMVLTQSFKKHNSVLPVKD